MKDPQKHSPRIADCCWGHVDVEGFGSLKDAKLYPGGARAWDWRETGTRHDPGVQPADVVELLNSGAEVVVLSTGVFRRLGVCPETLLLLKTNNVACYVLPTPEAVAAYNRLVETQAAVGALIHSTC
jgi:hypothetical protein